MFKKVILILFCFVVQQNFAQHCSEESKEQTDLNSISSISKCKVEDKKNATSNTISLKTRYLKKRNRNTNIHSILDASNKSDKNNSTESVELKNIKKNINSLVPSISKTSEKTVSFSDVDIVPLFTTCTESLEDQYDCFNAKMQEHISRNFNYPAEALNNKLEGTVLVSFVINTEGEITDIKTISSKNTEILKKEAVRIVSMLPKFVPGKNNNENVNVAYSFPMEFKIDNTDQL